MYQDSGVGLYQDRGVGLYQDRGVATWGVSRQGCSNMGCINIGVYQDRGVGLYQDRGVDKTLTDCVGTPTRGRRGS